MYSLENSVLSQDDILSLIRAIGDEELFPVVETIYTAEEPALPPSDIADHLDIEEPQVRSLVEKLEDAGVTSTRMACLIDEDCEAEQYELTEFGRMMLEDGVTAVFEAAGNVG